jgi:hypothetical protein
MMVDLPGGDEIIVRIERSERGEERATMTVMTKILLGEIKELVQNLENAMGEGENRFLEISSQRAKGMTAGIAPAEKMATIPGEDIRRSMMTRSTGPDYLIEVG